MPVLSSEDVLRAFPDWDIQRPPLGEGAFKSAYCAKRDGADVVVKIIREPHVGPSDAEEGELTLPERFAREIEAMRTLDTPRVVSILEGPDVKVIGSDLRLWYLEPLYPGGSVAKKLGQAWREGDVTCLVADMLEGVEALVAAGLVHRDIKPDNVVLDEDGRAVLLDLGIALHENRTPLTDDGGAGPHTPLYAAPEQLVPRRAATIDFRTDLFLIGLTAFEALTGVHPFKPQVPGMVLRLLDGEIDEAALDQASPSTAFRRVLVRLLGPNPNQRYRKLEHAREAIEGCR